MLLKTRFFIYNKHINIKEKDHMNINNTIKQQIINDGKTIINKRMLIIFALLFIIYTISDMGAVFFLIPLSFSLVPFRRDEYQEISVADQNKETVGGRYIFSILLLLAVILASMLISNVFSMFTAKNIDVINLSAIVNMIIIFLATSAILLPAYYIIGFKKGQYLLYFLVLLFAIFNLYQHKIPGLSEFMTIISKTPTQIIAAVGISISLFIYLISYLITIKLISKNN